MDWIKYSQVVERILWVHGHPSTRSIAQAVADILEQDHVSLATYFVSEDPNNEEVRARFIPTIAYQLGLSFPRVREEIGNNVAHDPAILSRSVSHQLDPLILQPLAPFLSILDDVVDTQYHPALIIVDGCDYLDNHTRTCIVNALLRISQQFPLRVRILLFTKLSDRITANLTLGVQDGSVAEIGVDNDRPLVSVVGKVWNRVKSIVSMNGRTQRPY